MPRQELLFRPKNREIYDYTPVLNVVRPTDTEGDGAKASGPEPRIRKMTVRVVWPGELAEVRIDIDPVLGRLYDLEKAAGVSAPDISVENMDLTYIFREGIYQEIPILSEYPEYFAQNVYNIL